MQVRLNRASIRSATVGSAHIQPQQHKEAVLSASNTSSLSFVARSRDNAAQSVREGGRWDMMIDASQIGAVQYRPDVQGRSYCSHLHSEVVVAQSLVWSSMSATKQKCPQTKANPVPISSTKPSTCDRFAGLVAKSTALRFECKRMIRSFREHQSRTGCQVFARSRCTTASLDSTHNRRRTSIKTTISIENKVQWCTA